MRTVKANVALIMKLAELVEPFTQTGENIVELVVDTCSLILLDVHVVNKKYLTKLDNQTSVSVIIGENRHLSIKYPKCIRIIMVAKTIHITEAQAEWLDDNAYNVSRLCRKVLDKIINDEIAKEFFTKNKTRAR